MSQDQKQLQAELAGILTTLLETGGGPESMIYLALNSNLDRWYALKSIMLQVGWITVQHNYVRLTAKGVDTAKKIEDLLAKK